MNRNSTNKKTRQFPGNDDEKRMNNTNLGYAIIIGIISSGVMGMYFKVIEVAYDIKVYTLLLNIDYFPILKDYEFPEIVEFSFHIVVSILIVILLVIVMQKFNWSKRQTNWRVIFISIAIGIIIYPTTILSERTPSLFSVISFSHWLVGHLLFGLTIIFCLKFFHSRSKL